MAKSRFLAWNMLLTMSLSKTPRVKPSAPTSLDTRTNTHGCHHVDTARHDVDEDVNASVQVFAPGFPATQWLGSWTARASETGDLTSKNRLVSSRAG